MPVHANGWTSLNNMHRTKNVGIELNSEQLVSSSGKASVVSVSRLIINPKPYTLKPYPYNG